MLRGLFLAVIGLGAVLRLAPVVGSEFPLNDGGLFMTMARDLTANGWVPPASTSYNDLGIPFAYPPGGFYLVGLLEAMGTGGSDILRWVPALISIATIPVVYLIGREIFRSGIMGLATAAFFAVSTGSYEWLLLGGGITRAPGFLLALLTVLLTIRAFRGGPRWTALLAGVGLGATALWHPQAAVFAGVSVVLLLPFTGVSPVTARRLAVILAVGAVIAVPWVAVVAAWHGLDVYFSAAGAGGTPIVGILSLLSSRSSAGHLEILGIATTVALALCAVRRFWLPVVWAIVIVVVDSRAGQPYLALPAALAIAFALGDFHAVAVRVLGDRLRSVPLARWTVPTVAALLFLGAFADSVVAQTTVDSPLRAVPREHREAMAWIRAETDADARFLVVTGRHWSTDATAEWFPVLGRRVSVGTVQGYEWLGEEAFDEQVERAQALPPCVAADDVACVEAWFAEAPEIDYVLLADSDVARAVGLECCLQLGAQVPDGFMAEPVYETATVLILRLDARDR